MEHAVQFDTLVIHLGLERVRDLDGAERRMCAGGLLWYLRKSDYEAGTQEGYPITPSKPNYPPVYAWTGFEKSFLRAGYEVVAQRSPTRPIMRKIL